MPGREVTSALNGANSYAIDLGPERLALWLSRGYGLGGTRLPRHGGKELETAFGLLADVAKSRGPLVSANTDGGWLRTASAATAGLAASTADWDGLRLHIGSYAPATGDLSSTYPGQGLAAGLRGRALAVYDTAEPVVAAAIGSLARSSYSDSELRPALMASASTGAMASAKPEAGLGATLAGAAPEQTVEVHSTMRS